MQLTLNVKRVVVLESEHKTDEIHIYVDLPSPIPIFNDPTFLQLDATKGTGVQYVKDNFGIEPDAIKV
jgi:hypothetical protein